MTSPDQQISHDEQFLLLDDSHSRYLQLSKNMLKTLCSVRRSLYLTILIDEYRYHSRNGSLKDDMFFLPYTKIQKELPLSILVMRRLKKELIADGIIYCQFKGMPAKEYIRLDFGKIKSIFLGSFKSKYNPDTYQKIVRGA